MSLQRHPGIEIRGMALADLAVVLEIQSACYTELIPESYASFHAKLNASPATCFVAVIAGDIVGYLIALPWEFSNPPPLNAETCQLPLSPDCLYLHDLAVRPSARKSGAGRDLVGAFLTALKQTGLVRASLVAVQNSAPYWERYGFEVAPLSDVLTAKLATYGEGVEYMVLETSSV